VKVSISRTSLRTTGLVLVVLLCLHAQVSDFFFMVLQLAFALLFLLLYLLLFFNPSPEAAQMRHLLFRLLLAAFLSAPLMLPIWKWQTKVTRTRAATIIQQLDTYQRQYGYYPDSLSQLVPHYLSSVPTTGYGLWHSPTFEYHLRSSANPGRTRWFELRYYSGSFATMTFDSQSKKWHYDD
jgi:hypothetical protein